MDIAKEGGEWQTAWSGAAAADTTAARLERLAPATRYRLRVAAANAAGEGAWSTPAAAATLRLPPPAPLDVEAAPRDGCARDVDAQVGTRSPHPPKISGCARLYPDSVRRAWP